MLVSYPREHVETQQPASRVRRGGRAIRVASLVGAVVMLAGILATPALAAPVLQLPWPTGAKYRINGGYTYGCGDHTGRDAFAIDFALPSGSPVSAAAAGVAHTVAVANSGGYGNLVWINHGGGFVSLYAHLSSFRVSNGQSVAQGQVIGISGATGHVSGAHLHFSIRSNASNWYSGSALKPEPMSGYTGFGSYGIHKSNGCSTNAPSPYYTSSPPSSAWPPPDGSLVSSTSTGAVYVIAGGAPLYISSWSVVGGPKPTIPAAQAQIDALPAVPENGTFVVGEPSGRVYTIAGGAPMYVSSWAAVGGVHPTVTIDDWDVANAGSNAAAHLNPVPANGTYVVGEPSGRVYVVAGGAALYVSSWSDVGGPFPTVTIDDWDVANAGENSAAHLNLHPSNGTILEAMPAGSYWLVENDTRAAASADPTAVQADQTAVFAIPLSP